jgi:hypothetical protein
MSNTFDEFNAWRLDNQLPILLPHRKRKQRAVSLSDEAYNGLRHIAEQYRTMRGDKVSLSSLLEQIGLGYYIVTPRRPTQVE